jgi:hypothetical protein
VNGLLLLAILLCGYSVFTALLLVSTHFRSESYAGQPLERALGISLILALGGLQLCHFSYLMGHDGVHGAFYQTLLFGIAPAFYLFSQPLIRAQIRYSPRQALHLLPLTVAPWLPSSLAAGLCNRRAVPDRAGTAGIRLARPSPSLSP